MVQPLMWRFTSLEKRTKVNHKPSMETMIQPVLSIHTLSSSSLGVHYSPGGLHFLSQLGELLGLHTFYRTLHKLWNPRKERAHFVLRGR